MKQTTQLLLILFFFTNFSFGQSADTISLKVKAFKNYSACIQAHKEKNVNEYLKYVHPVILKQAGKEKVFQNNASTPRITKGSISTIGKIYLDNQAYQFTFTEITSTDVEKTENTNSYTVIAMSYDKGKNWVFFNAYDSVESMQEDIPELNANLKVIYTPKQNFKF
ncbi:hypothetical protein [Flavobacterium sp. 25HG05S-40]|uniref:hypothetical protein n=1 Tax=Flavobacterium sp. 25HG05S-40 TaxID=3458682 RepID=UPI004043CC74